MFRDRPLTWLFVIATVTIDLVLLTFDSETDVPSMIKLGLIVGQLAALAIWSVRGRIHRLSRIAFLVIGTTMLTFAMRLGPEQESLWLAFHALYTLTIVLITCVVDYLRYRIKQSNRNYGTSTPWQISLIELFGWTIVVSVISFGARQMDFEFIDGDSLKLIAAFLSIPCALVCLIHNDLRELTAVKATIFVFVVIVAAYYFATEADIGWMISFSQAVYLVVWALALGMDGMRFQAKEIGESLSSHRELLDSQD